jgi:hypothetical protein
VSLDVRRDFPVTETCFKSPVTGATMPLIYLDHAASTHAPSPVLRAHERFLREAYANVHRGAHFLSERATDAFEHARERVKGFVGATSDREAVFVMNTTQALNLASHVACSKHDGPVLTTKLEHHSNLLPHQSHGDCETVHVTADGRIDLDELETRLRRGPRPRLLALSCASNVTGVKTPMREVLEHAQDARVPVLFDGAQLLAHERDHRRRIALAARQQVHEPSRIAPVREVGNRIGLGLVKVRLSHVWDDADDGCCQRGRDTAGWRRAAREVDAQYDPPADRILLWKMHLHEPCVDDRAALARSAIRIGECSSTKDRQANGFEIARVHGQHRHRWRLFA